jgi:L-threonylcarbamoyladenylate synthase
MRVVRVGDGASRRATLREAAELLRSGRLVAFPTETVYGLGAHALNEEAVGRIYEAKGRPKPNPLIVHVASARQARDLALDWTPVAEAIAKAFWPGPITLVVRKRSIIPGVVTAGLDTVGLRVPAHPVALALLEEARIPVAAPSANLSTQVSPTTAQHVVRGLGHRVDLILDGGPTTVGIESTVVDVTGSVPRILRPGMIGGDAIARVAGVAEVAVASQQGTAPQSPGTLGKHYSPRARLTLFHREKRDVAVRDAQDAIERGQRVGAMVFTTLRLNAAQELTMPAQPEGYARALYATLHALDEAQCDLVLIELPPDSPEWTAIIDRLQRAAEA